jgi:hypothetical protein
MRIAVRHEPPRELEGAIELLEGGTAADPRQAGGVHNAGGAIMSNNVITREKLTELVNELDAARSAVFVCARALDEGIDHSDLELHCATTLKKASDTMDGVYDELVALRVGMAAQRRSAEP